MHSYQIEFSGAQAPLPVEQVIGDNFLADIRNEAGLEDVLFLGFRQLEEVGKGGRNFLVVVALSFH